MSCWFFNTELTTNCRTTTCCRVKFAYGVDFPGRYNVVLDLDTLGSTSAAHLEVSVSSAIMIWVQQWGKCGAEQIFKRILFFFRPKAGRRKPCTILFNIRWLKVFSALHSVNDQETSRVFIWTLQRQTWWWWRKLRTMRSMNMTINCTHIYGYILLSHSPLQLSECSLRKAKDIIQLRTGAFAS